MPCSRKEALAKFLFNNVINIIKFFFLFIYFFSIYFAKLLTFLFRLIEDDDEYEDESSCEGEDKYDDEKGVEEKEDDDENSYSSQVEEEHHLVADIVNKGDTLVFLDLHGANEHAHVNNNVISHVHSNSYESLFHDPIGDFDNDDETTVHFDDNKASFTSSEFELESNGVDIVSQNNDGYEVISEEFTSRLESNHLDGKLEFIEDDNHNNSENCEPIMFDDDVVTKSPSFIEIKAYGSEINVGSNHYNGKKDENETNVVKEDANFTKDEKFLIFDPQKSEVKKLLQDMEKEKEGMFEDTYTVGSTSKSSSDWRSSMRDSAITDDPYSSSSRRSCPKWESYAVYQKYDQEMMFLDRISAQKLHETESLKSFQVEPRSISQRIVHKLAHKKNSNDEIYKKSSNPYNELEVAYVAQICLAWEALNWNYATFKRKQVSKTQEEKENDNGCPAYIAQQFQQFQVLLQRYIENEPYQRCKRPEIYARMRSVSPKLLQVPEYHDYEEGEQKEDSGGRIESTLFMNILEDAIQTIMNFLKADRETHCQIIKKALFKAKPKGAIDPNVINAIKKHNHKKKLKLKDLQRSSTHICFKKRKLSKEQEIEILMGLIDLKVVSRVLRMENLTPEQIHWCEAKMGKHSILDGKLLRDSSPLFFPAH